MTLTITINLDSAAFGEQASSRSDEVERLLKEVILNTNIFYDLFIGNIDFPYTFFDINGNRCGTITLTK